MLSYYICSDIVRYVLSSSATKCLLTAALRVIVPPRLFSSIWRTAHIMTLVIMKLSRTFCYFLHVRVRNVPQPLILKHPTSMYFRKRHTTVWGNIADVRPQLFQICQCFLDRQKRAQQHLHLISWKEEGIRKVIEMWGDVKFQLLTPKTKNGVTRKWLITSRNKHNIP
jgi:hypothetical protein